MDYNSPIPIPVKTSTNILGYRTDQRLNGNNHINALLKKSNSAFNSIQRFRSAPEKVNMTLYKSIIRPTFEYAPVPSIRSKKSHLDKLQKFQNKVLRFINGSRLIDRIPNNVLHNKFRIENIKDRLSNLAKNQINKILSDDLEHTHILQNRISSLPQGQSLWQDIVN